MTPEQGKNLDANAKTILQGSINSKYARFAGRIIARAWCDINDELLPDEEPLTAESVLQLAQEYGVPTKPPAGWLKHHHDVKNLGKSMGNAIRTIEGKLRRERRNNKGAPR